MTPASLVTLLLLTQAAPVHAAHYPRYGGQLVAAADDTLHVEGVWSIRHVFKLHIYDRQSQPVPLARLRGVSGRVIVNGMAAPLVLRADDALFEARLPALAVPADISVELKVSPRDRPERLVFSFPVYIDETAPAQALERTPIPETLDATIDALHADVDAADALLERKQPAYVFAPATRARDHALALERFLASGGADRSRAEAAIREVVRVAWLLHMASDEGTLEQVQGGLDELERLIDELPAAFARAAP